MVLLVLWLIVWGAPCYTLAYDNATSPFARYNTPTLSSDVLPQYVFQSTSTCTPVVGETSYTSGYYAAPANAPMSGPHNSSPWDRPNGDEIGVIFTPVGEPYILLMIAFAYMIGIFLKRRSKKGKTPDDIR